MTGAPPSNLQNSMLKNHPKEARVEDDTPNGVVLPMQDSLSSGTKKQNLKLMVFFGGEKGCRKIDLETEKTKKPILPPANSTPSNKLSVHKLFAKVTDLTNFIKLSVKKFVKSVTRAFKSKRKEMLLHISFLLKLNGDPRRTRTFDPMVKSHLLYRLSYRTTQVEILKIPTEFTILHIGNAVGKYCVKLFANFNL